MIARDLVQETSNTSGTGTWTLVGETSGHRQFSDALFNGDTFFYCARQGTDWEIGVGTYSSSGDTIARTQILESSNGYSAVDFSTPVTISLVCPAGAQLIYAPYGGYASIMYPSATGEPALAVGALSQATGDYSIAIGDSCVVSGDYASAIGTDVQTSADKSMILGYLGRASIPGELVWAGCPYTTSQYRILHGTVQTTNNTPADLSAGGTSPTAAFALPENTTWAFEAIVSARNADDLTHYARKFHGLIAREGSTTALVGSVTETTFANDAGFTGSVAVTADDTNDALKLTVTGMSSKTIRWGVVIQVTEVR